MHNIWQQLPEPVRKSPNLPKKRRMAHYVGLVVFHVMLSGIQGNSKTTVSAVVDGASEDVGYDRGETLLD